MSTLVLGEQPFMAAWLARRQAEGHDHRDEVWEGVYHVVPHASWAHARVGALVLRALSVLADERGLLDCGEFNLGGPDDYRVPDAGWVRPATPRGLFVPTAEVVLEVLSPGDETYQKFGFYGVAGVREILVADPEARAVTCHGRVATAPGEQWRDQPTSEVFGCSMEWLVAQVTWP